jgi:hypothetical protein
MGLKKVLAVAAVVLGLSGASVAAAPSASAIPVHVRGAVDGDVPSTPLCVRVNITLFGNPIGTGPEFICLT